MNPIYFESDPANVRIRIGINPEIQIRIPDEKVDRVSYCRPTKQMSDFWLTL